MSNRTEYMRSPKWVCTDFYCIFACSILKLKKTVTTTATTTNGQNGRYILHKCYMAYTRKAIEGKNGLLPLVIQRKSWNKMKCKPYKNYHSLHDNINIFWERTKNCNIVELRIHPLYFTVHFLFTFAHVLLCRWLSDGSVIYLLLQSLFAHVN